jgi:predicted unusual protein kinase regulating ubiquinone biosynthesis (AarF/ABC1/UbiB family)
VLIAFAIAAALVVAAAAVAWAAAPARPRRVAGGRGTRLFRIGGLGARMSASWLGARARRLFASRERRARLDEAQRRANAERVAATMGQMKGAVMKLGQMLSFVSEEIPAEYRAALASLQAAAPPMDFAVLRDVAERELGRPLERAFARFDATPLAAASIGQVHRAQLPSGEEVVVKIQYPGVADAIRADLENAAVLYRFAMLMYPAVDVAPIVDELRGRISEELDYELEARNQSAFCELYDAHPFIRVPRVIREYSTARVLTSEYIEGRRFADLAQMDEAARQRYAEILYRFVIGSILRFGVFNGDPHPGNYLFASDGKMVFLDFGCVKYFPDDMMARWKRLLHAHLHDDKVAFRDLVVELGFIARDKADDVEALFDYFGYFYEPWKQDRVFTFNKEYTRQSFGIVFKPEGRYASLGRAFNMPRDFVFVNRIQWGIHSILADLAASNNWHRIERELLLGESPATELGHADAKWLAEWRARHNFEGADIRLSPTGFRRVA